MGGHDEPAVDAIVTAIPVTAFAHVGGEFRDVSWLWCMRDAVLSTTFPSADSCHPPRGSRQHLSDSTRWQIGSTRDIRFSACRPAAAYGSDPLPLGSAIMPNQPTRQASTPTRPETALSTIKLTSDTQQNSTRVVISPKP